MDKQKSYAVPIFMMVLLFGMISFVTNLAAPMGIVLKAQFDLSNFMGILGNAANFIAYAIMGIPSGILLQKVGYKKTALIAIAVGFVGVGIQFLSGHSGDAAFVVYLIGALVAGFSMCLLNTVVNPMLNTLGGGGNRGNKLIQIGGSFNSVMATITPIFVGILIGEISKSTSISDIFPFMYTAMAVFAVVFIVLSMVQIPEPHAEQMSEPMGTLMAGALKFRHFVLGAIGIFVYVGVEVGTPGIMNYFLVDASIPNPLNTTAAGFVAGTYWLLMFVGRLVGASVGDKVSARKMLTFTSALGIVLVIAAIFAPINEEVTLPVLKSEAGITSFGFLDIPLKAGFLVLVGLCTSIMWGSIFNLAVRGLGKYLPAASGIFMMLVCGGGILPALQGAIADNGGFMTSYWVIVAGLVYLLFYALVGSKTKEEKNTAK